MNGVDSLVLVVSQVSGVDSLISCRVSGVDSLILSYILVVR